ncbi:hypothetical protein [Streptomyces sp. NPDC048473]
MTTTKAVKVSLLPDAVRREAFASLVVVAERREVVAGAAERALGG